MVFRALSDRVKRIKQLRTQSNILVQAVHAYCVEQARPTGEKRKGVRTIAEEFGVPKQYKTILNHATGKTWPLSEYMTSKQKILAAEEHIMVHFLLKSAKRGFPLTKALNPSNVNHWFSLVKEHIVNKGIRPEDIYGMDESGFPLTNTQSHQENVTGIVTICADGTALCLTIIFKGQNFMQKWGDNNVAHAFLCHSPNGWTDAHVLLMDGHSSHFTPELLKYAMDNNITILRYLPHSSFNEEKADFTGTFGHAFVSTFTPDLVKTAFCVTADQMKPSEESSTCSTFLLPYSSPTRAVLAAFTNYQPTSFELSPNTHKDTQPIAGPSQFPGSHESLSSAVATKPNTPDSPSRRHYDSEITDTPSKHMRLMTASLSQTSSSFLVSKTWMSKGQLVPAPVFKKPPVLPEPDWSLLIAKQASGDEMRDIEHWKTCCLDLEEALWHAKHQLATHEQINAGQNAQIIIQDLTLRKLNETLNTVKLYPKGNRRHMTEHQFIDELKEDPKRAKKVEVRKQRKAARDVRHGKGVELVTQWNEIKEKHAAAVRDWQVECEHLNVEGVRKKDWPKKPKWPLKPK
ncbi:uncharacterized protein BJ212DRAFT_1450220 [Suillus subaureus]|uniref:DDE-1 domain-containing protein n=1 Tax=Suillus subaureus TaxID=48587 RepID=A0A9P7DPU5_9AGAM|nr:uncharacterized protein BJ212DRAFT_1450220 [Suillus subaureus]KAG1800022.1 hypothetical protein BJ212DRAFT_1450220 [Suillus subaureus]